jgi:hypothetical protein
LIGEAETRFHQGRGYALQIWSSLGGKGEPLRLGQLQRDIPGDDFGDPVPLCRRSAVAVKQGVGRDSEETNRRQRRDA